MEIDLKKNPKLTKIIMIILVGILFLVVTIPTGNKVSTKGNSKSEEAYIEGQSEEYYEQKLKLILEKSYGEGTMEVMIHFTKGNETDSLYGESTEKQVIDGVLVVADIKTKKEVSDITFAVCALFDLPVHKVAVLIKN